MGTSQQDSRGFTLIAALLLTVLLSGVAVGLLFMVSNEVRMGGNDLEGNLAYYGAEAGIENLTSQLSQLYQSSQTPTQASINALTSAANWPTAVSGSHLSNITYNAPGGGSGMSITWPKYKSDGVTLCPNFPDPCGSWDIVGSGPDQGMVASLIPFTLQVTATRLASAGQIGNHSALAATGASVNLTRTVEVALLPAFEFGIFCEGDCDYFAGPDFNFGGRVHTNGNLFLAEGGKLTFTDKIAAVGQVVMDQLENGHATSSGYGGTTYVPSAAGACPNAPAAGPAANCANLTAGSWTGGFPPTGAANPAWTGISKSTFNGFIENGLTGATKLQLPFVQSSKVGAIDIIRRPTTGDTPLLLNSRLYKEADIRILLADTEGDLYPGEARTDPGQDIQIGTPFTNTAATVAVGVAAPTVTAGNMYYATALKGAATNNWTAAAPTGCNVGLATWPLHGEVTQAAAANKCLGAWLRVEYLNAAGNWVGVTTEWLKYGFGRNYNQPPTHPYNASPVTVPLCKNYTGAVASLPLAQCQNGISPAILILQQLQSSQAVTKGMGAAATNSAWLPINFYDSREGEPRDNRPSTDPGPGKNCSPVGIMNSVELDMGNLWLWLQGAAGGPYAGGSGKLVNATTYNGYILYFSDHRGMIPDLHPLTAFQNGFSGMSGLSDVINSGSAAGVPDNKLEPITYYATAPVPYSPEDTAVKGNGFIDNWGQANLGAGFGIALASMGQPYYISGATTNAIQCTSTSPTTYNMPDAEWNMVSGPRHVLRLVDGGMDAAGNSFLPPTNGVVAVNGNGLTLASEEPVYVWGDYNTGPNDPFWPSENTGTTPHSATAIIADAVTLLSNPPSNATVPTANVGWTDLESFQLPYCGTKNSVAGFASCGTGRYGNTSYYRMAIIAGKSVPFPQPAWGSQDMGTDGGMHNFLRYLEDRSDNGNGGQVNYAGSMISMYYSQYATGIFKCCNSVYGAPKRNYFFDTQFLNPANLPPGTPSFQDVVSLSYHQNFTPQ